MKRSVLHWAVWMLAFVWFSTPVSAHHGTSAYDMTNPITLKGTITEFDLVNPHSIVYFDVTDDKGNVVHWVAESIGPGRALRAGWTRDSLKPGDQVTITLNPAKNGRPVGFLREVVLPNGKKLTIKEPD